MFLPTTKTESAALGWEQLDIILVTGDGYIDSPFIGIAVIGKVLVAAGYRVGVIAQPDPNGSEEIARLGEPLLFWGVSGGSIDSMVANYTATKKRRKQDDYTPGGVNNRRPDRAVICYSNLIRRAFKGTKPIVLGGIEASLRRISHYDFWDNKIRRSILFDAKADFLLYGMAENSVCLLADRLRRGQAADDLPGLCYIAAEPPPAALRLPSFQEVSRDKSALLTTFKLFYANNDPLTAQGLAQQQDTRYLVQNPPAPPLSGAELDRIHELDYERDAHPSHRPQGPVRALETIRFSLTTHRGCYGECNFCAIAIHQGRTVHGRSPESLRREAVALTKHPAFKGTILDVGGPTANMYGFECPKKLAKGSCARKRCLFPTVCPSLPIDHRPLRDLLRLLRKVPGVNHLFVASGVRYDLVLADRAQGRAYLQELIAHHVSGQMKIAPEHSEEEVLRLMGKPSRHSLLKFTELFAALTAACGKNQFLTYYLIAAHPGCTMAAMGKLKEFTRQVLKTNPEQVQIFTPTPSTFSTLMYWTELDPASGNPIFVEKDLTAKESQKNVITAKGPRRPPFCKKVDQKL